MHDIYLLHGITVGGMPHQAGEIVPADDEDYRYTLIAGHARDATADDKRDAKNPRPAADVRAEMDAANNGALIATAIPGGKRPNRKTVK